MFTYKLAGDPASSVELFKRFLLNFILKRTCICKVITEGRQSCFILLMGKSYLTPYFLTNRLLPYCKENDHKR